MNWKRQDRRVTGSSLLLNLFSFRMERTTGRLASINDKQNLSLCHTAWPDAGQDANGFTLVEYLHPVSSAYWPSTSLKEIRLLRGWLIGQHSMSASEEEVVLRGKLPADQIQPAGSSDREKYIRMSVLHLWPSFNIRSLIVFYRLWTHTTEVRNRSFLQANGVHRVISS